MDNSGTSDTNMTNQTSPFAPLDIPDLNSIPTQGAMPPMGMGGVQMTGVMPVGQEVAGQAQMTQAQAAQMMQAQGQTGQGQVARVPQVGQAAQATQGQMQGQAQQAQVAQAERAMQSQAGAQGQNGQTRAQEQVAQGQATNGAREQGAKSGEVKSDAERGTTTITMSDIPEPKLQAEGASDEKKADMGNDKKELKKIETVKNAEGAAQKAEAEKKAGEAGKVEAKASEVAKVAASAAVAGAAVAGAAASAAGVVAATGALDGITIEPLLEECIRQNASDLHLQVGLPPVLRVDGTLRPMTTYPVLDNEMVQKLVFSTLDEDQQQILMRDKEFDYSFAFGDLGRFRVNAFHEKGNMAAAFRLIPNIIKTVEELGIPGVVESFAERPNGLVLVTGPTGSGKSTTLAALVDKVNTERAVHIITIEDPIEFTHRSKRAVVAQREVHYDTYSFAAALRSILREDPDVVLIGEMRDLETIQAAITVAETGHLVFATLHTNSAAQSIDRMIDVFPAHQQPQIRAQLASILVGICSQRLIPAINGGRIAVAEILVANPAVRAIIREGKTHQLDMAIQTGLDQGMQTMDRELAKYVRGGIISYDVAREYAVDPTEFDRLTRG